MDVSGRKLVAVVDDEEAVRIGLGALLRSADVAAELFPSADAFLASDVDRYGVVFSDIQMPGRSGLDLLIWMRSNRPDIPVVLMTAFPDERVRLRAEAGGAHRFLTKPCSPDEIIGLAETLLVAGS